MYIAHTKLEAIGDFSGIAFKSLNLEAIGEYSGIPFTSLDIDSILDKDGKDSGITSSIGLRATLDDLGDYSGIAFTAKSFDGMGTFDFEQEETNEAA